MIFLSLNIYNGIVPLSKAKSMMLDILQKLQFLSGAMYQTLIGTHSSLIFVASNYQNRLITIQKRHGKISKLSKTYINEKRKDMILYQHRI